VTLTELLDTARQQLVRIEPVVLCQLMVAGEVIVLDTRTPTDRAAYGCIPGSFHAPRTVLEWRVALDAPLRLSCITGLDQLIVVVCNEGFSSSLAAVSLQSLGFHRATDLVGGVVGWLAAGLPVIAPFNDEMGIRCDADQSTDLTRSVVVN
jgi:rhodanese-related sulfurtransferase